MSEIPPRVAPSRFNSSDETARADAYMCQCDHEHAAAKVAVEALRRLMPRARGIAYEGRRPEFAVDVETAEEALAAIEASGWRP